MKISKNEFSVGILSNVCNCCVCFKLKYLFNTKFVFRSLHTNAIVWCCRCRRHNVILKQRDQPTRPTIWSQLPIYRSLRLPHAYSALTDRQAYRIQSVTRNVIIITVGTAFRPAATTRAGPPAHYHRMKLSEKHKIKLMVQQTKTNNQKHNHNNNFICLMGWLDATGSGRDWLICFTA